MHPATYLALYVPLFPSVLEALANWVSCSVGFKISTQASTFYSKVHHNKWLFTDPGKINMVSRVLNPGRHCDSSCKSKGLIWSWPSETMSASAFKMPSNHRTWRTGESTVQLVLISLDADPKIYLTEEILILCSDKKEIPQRSNLASVLTPISLSRVKIQDFRFCSSWGN